ncbi:MAG TPA: hypothetical protein VGF88_23640 [Acidobacteriaceae bacterium]|jgi:hypothetical protein
MPVLSAKVDIDGPLRAFADLRQNQIPFTIARALTMTAIDARNQTRTLEERVFKLRNDWTRSRTLTRMATKQDLTAAVYTDTANRRTGAPDYLPRQEDSGTKTPSGRVVVDGGAYIGVPTRYLTALVGQIIPGWARPQQLLQNIKSRGSRRRGGPEGPTVRGFVTMGHVFFAATLKSGNKVIMARALGSRDAMPMYMLIRSAHIPAIFPAFEEVQRTAQANFPSNFSKAATETIANDLLRGSGVRVKL